LSSFTETEKYHKIQISKKLTEECCVSSIPVVALIPFENISETTAMNRSGVKNNRSLSKWIFHACSVAMASAFVQQPRLPNTLHRFRQLDHSLNKLVSVASIPRRVSNRRTAVYSSVETNENVENKNAAFDELLEEPSKFGKAIRFFRSHSDEIEMTRDRFGKIFDAIEERTSDAEVNVSDQQQQQQQQQPMISESRNEMTEMYSLLKEQGHLRLYGAITKENMPASGSHNVRPTMLEAITSLPMSSLTPKPSNTLMYAGIAVALIESIASAYLGLDLNAIFFATFGAALCDQLFLNGAVSETLVKILSPETQPKITRHEAGHFLCSYILGCPVEGYVLSAWGALEDPRFRGRGVSAGTSFFDPTLSSQIEKSKITRSSIDRYSIIVMAGIAAEAVMYGRADGGAGDEQALIGRSAGNNFFVAFLNACSFLQVPPHTFFLVSSFQNMSLLDQLAFLSNLNGPSSSSAPVWNDFTIRNQARWYVDTNHHQWKIGCLSDTLVF